MKKNSCFFKYRFSVIMAVYNVELFLEEAIESVVRQDIGFEKYVQLILVDDGSTDESGKLCDQYQQEYPENVVVIHKENGGVSSARNAGINCAEGEYVNFLDADDKLSTDALRLVYQQFELWKNQISLITIPMYFFDGAQGAHVLNNKFAKGTRIIDLEKEYDKIVLTTSASFIKNEVIKKYCFDEQLSHMEDAKILTQILLEKEKYGVLKEAKYFYRKRNIGEESAVQGSVRNRKWYLNCTKHFHIWILDYSKKVLNEIPLFVQFLVMYDLQWRFMTAISPEEVLSEEECKKYYDRIKSALRDIEDTIILAQSHLSLEYKLQVLQFKYEKKPNYEYVDKDIRYFYDTETIAWESSFVTRIEFIQFKNEIVAIEGKMFLPVNNCEDKINIYIRVNDKMIRCEKIARSDRILLSMGKQISYEVGFKIEFSPEPGKENKVSFFCEINGLLVQKKIFGFGKFSPLSALWNSYVTSSKYLVMFFDGELHIYPYSIGKHVYREMSFLKKLLMIKSKAAHKAVFLRIFCHIRNIFPQKDIWLISDRIDKADDNGEALFEYLNRIKPTGIRYYYAISKKVSDYKRMKKIGRTINLLGWHYKWLLLCGAKIISSQGDEYVYRPFADYSYCYKDLLAKSKFVFLQHGVTKDDISRWLNRNNKDIRIFVTTTVPEYNSILNGNYGYNSDVVKLTGFPRYDRLYHNEKRKIAIMPSWRAYLVGNIDVHTGKRIAKSGFSESKYCKMYSDLLTNEELLSYIEKYGYELQFISHPNMGACTELLSIDSRVKVFSSDDIVYRKVFAESNLIVTDYSSVAFDFAYLRKPVLYFQADQKEFFSGSHTYDKGYFEYVKDGFGEVAYDVNTLVDLIKGYIDTDCKLKGKFLKRINDTFPYDDKNNCKRVYEEICDLK